ncbi:ImmA/IrrE family metallo-endopeptidase [bacterium]|nr:ImmA/IrrE family metallo-endopeptidase [bacterium]
MMGKASIEVELNPELLAWGRRSVGLSIADVARKLKQQEQTIKEWEGGSRKIRYAQLEKLADIYARPVAVFFLENPPESTALPRDFRLLPEKDRQQFSRQTLLAFRRAKRFQKHAAQLLDELAAPSEQLDLHAVLKDDPIAVATSTRELLRVTLQAQFSWKSYYHAFRELRNIIEEQGLFVFQFPMPIEEIRGYFLSHKLAPVIVVNRSDWIQARIFTLLHEFGHYILDEEGISGATDITDYDGWRDTHESRIERFCNVFATEFLMPRDVFEAECQNIHGVHSQLGGYSDPAFVGKIAMRFSVSLQAALLRLYKLSLLDVDEYTSTRALLVPKKKKHNGGSGLTAEEICVQERGHKYVSLMVSASRDGRLSPSEVADLLGVAPQVAFEIEGVM